jgi:4-hydroxybenzoate polyprenyltransferase
MKPKTALKLGRVSNLPTIWTNCFVGFAIASVTPDVFNLILICLAFSLFYAAGMFLNDLFDYQWDKRHQPERPIVIGDASRREVLLFSIVFILTGVGCVLIASDEEFVSAALLGTLMLIACIWIYDWKHKNWLAFSPWLMGACRLLVYWTVALTVAPFSYTYALPGLCLMCYIAGITYLAQAEHVNKLTALWPICLLGAPLIYAVFLGRHSLFILLLALALVVWLGLSVKMLLSIQHRSIPKAVSNLLAGICLIDGLILAGMMHYTMAAISVFAFFITLFLQNKIKAT